ncbi:MAG: nucleotidyltransferase domain-containing protein [Thermoproteota archaeon]
MKEVNACYYVKGRSLECKTLLAMSHRSGLQMDDYEELHISAKEYLKEAFRMIRDKVLKTRGIGKVRAIVAFGSSARPEDFVIGSSDIDILVLTDRKSNKRQYFKFRDSRVDVTYASVEEVKKAFELGHPFAFILHDDNVILRDDGTFSSLMKIRPKVTGHTLRVLRNSVFVALGLAIESYFHEDYERAVSHAYHAIRHFARYNAIKKNREAGRFPISNEEVSKTLIGETSDLFIKLLKKRGKAVAKEECKEMLERTIRAIASGLDLKHPTLSFVEENLQGEVSLILTREVGDSMVIIVEAITEEGIKRLEIRESYVKEIKNLSKYEKI